jgi:ATP-dependent helicase/nuclease subunit A
MGVLVAWPGEAPWPQKFIFLASESRPPLCAVAALDCELLERQREELNALYVAMTRARQTLAISSIEPHRAAQRSWWQRLDGLASSVTPDELSAQVLAQAPDSTEVFFIKELPLAPLSSAPTAASSEADSVSARIGKAMHRLLQWIDSSSVNVAAVVREFALTPAQGLQAADMADRIRRGEGAWAWDDEVLAWQGNEVEVMCQNQLLRIDRLVQRRDGAHAGEWWVLDYKSALAPQQQTEMLTQLRSYRSAVQCIYSDATVRAAFLTAQGHLLELLEDS